MNELVKLLMSQLSIQEGQAKGGAGLIFKLAQEKLGGDFSKLATLVPGIQEMIASAPAAGGAGKLLGGLLGKLAGGKAGSLGDLASLAGGFSKLGLNKDMVAKFVPVITGFLKGKGGADAAALLGKLV